MLFRVVYTQVFIRDRSDVMDMQGGDVGKVDGGFVFRIVFLG